MFAVAVMQLVICSYTSYVILQIRFTKLYEEFSSSPKFSPNMYPPPSWD